MLPTAPRATLRDDVLLLFRAARVIMRRHARERLKLSEDVDGHRMTLSARPLGPRDDTAADLPAELGAAPPKSVRRVYRLLRAARRDLGADVLIQPGDLMGRWLAAYPNSPPKKDTIKQALRHIRRCGVAYPAPGRGWVFGREQGVLFSGPHGCPVPDGAAAAYAARVGCDPRARDRREPTMTTRYIWVPLSEDGLVVDARTDAAYQPAADARTAELTFEGKVRRRTVPAVRAELTGTEGEGRHRLAVARVRTADGAKLVRILVLGDWHLAGEREQPAEEPAAAG
jgi:hypothetical protein